MQNNIEKRFGKGPFPFPIEQFSEFLEFYDSSVLNICQSKCDIVFSKDDPGHSHEAYEFMMPVDPFPFTGIGDKCVYVDANNILPINSWQPHGPRGKMRTRNLMAIHIDRDFLNDVSYQIYGINNFQFRNIPLIPNKDIHQMMSDFMSEARNEQSGHEFILECISTQLVVKLLRLEKDNESDENISKSISNNNINKVIEFLRSNYYSNNYSTKEIAKIANLSTYHFIRAFKQQTGKTPYEYLMDIKVEKAKEMLINNCHTITEICFLCGFTNHSHFSSAFKKKLGISPSEYRKIVSGK